MVLNDVSDTAFWVALYREEETARPDALFRDPLAALLVGDRGRTIEKRMSDSRYVRWSVVIRTRIIDRFIQDLISEGVDTVINLGAGLDTRPYRLELPGSLRWIEVDFPKIISFKEERLAGKVPRCRLERIGMDLSNEAERRKVFSRLSTEAGTALVLTEGVTPYLSNEDVASLARSLRAQPSFRHWICDYNSPELMKYLSRRRKREEMRNAPFQFNPPEWSTFFAELGWKNTGIRYIGEEGDRLGRPIPHPWWVKLIQRVFVSAESRAAFKRYNGYAVLTAE